MSLILSSKTSFPQHQYSQTDLASFLSDIHSEKADVIKKIFKNALVEKRNLALPLQNYKDINGLQSRNDQWIKNAIDLQTKNLNYFFNELNFPIQDIGMIISTTITGLSIPSVEAKLMNIFPFKTSTKRLPIFGLGCLGGVASIARAHDYLKQYKNEAVLILATELCSLTFQLDDFSMVNIVGCSLFSDGAGAVLMVGKEHAWANRAKYEVIDTNSIFFPNSERMMGWDIVDTGFKLVLSGEMPQIIEERLAPEYFNFLAHNSITLDNIAFFLSHTGGPKVLSSLEDSLKIPNQFLNLSYESLKEQGNMSSVSVIHVLEKSILQSNSSIYKNKKGVMLAMGPAFCSELILVKGL